MISILIAAICGVVIGVIIHSLVTCSTKTLLAMTEYIIVNFCDNFDETKCKRIIKQGIGEFTYNELGDSVKAKAKMKEDTDLVNEMVNNFYSLKAELRTKE